MTEITRISQLKIPLRLCENDVKTFQKVVRIHPFKTTEYYLSLITGGESDPIRKMIFPSGEELKNEGSYDSSNEKGDVKIRGLQHKYPQTALIITTNNCASYCRYCFRKRMVGLPNGEVACEFNKIIDYVKRHEEINNILLSGGDPLTLSTKSLGFLFRSLLTIDHIRFIRIGTKIPVVAPEKISKDNSLLNLFKKYSSKDKRIYVITHFNHPKEITKKTIFAIDKLVSSGVILRNQTVLLRGVNDNPEVLAELMNRLVSIGISPYYVFQCRPVKRVKNIFQVPIIEGCEIIEQTKKGLSGLGKGFRYVMSHSSGKIEILGRSGKYVYFRYHQVKNNRLSGKIFKRRLSSKDGWL